MGLVVRLHSWWKKRKNKYVEKEKKVPTLDFCLLCLGLKQAQPKVQCGSLWLQHCSFQSFAKKLRHHPLRVPSCQERRNLLLSASHESFIINLFFYRKRRTCKRTAAVKIHLETILSDSTLSADRMTICTGFHGNRAIVIYRKHLRPGLTHGSIFRCKKMRPNLILVRLMRAGSVWWFISFAARLSSSSEDWSSLAKLVKLLSLQTLRKYLLQHCATQKIFPESFLSFADTWKYVSWYNYGKNETAQARLEL